MQNDIVLKTSEEWQIYHKDKVIILDPDGWDRSNLEHSFYEELISEKEFWKRVSISTCSFSREYLDSLKEQKTIILVVGLPGSGKSNYLKNIPKDGNPIIFDDILENSIVPKSGLVYSKWYPVILNSISANENNIYISDISFCNYDIYKETVDILNFWIENINKEYDIHTICFKNSPDICKINIEKDGNEKWNMSTFNKEMDNFTFNNKDTTSSKNRIKKVEEFSKIYDPNKYNGIIFPVGGDHE